MMIKLVKFKDQNIKTEVEVGLYKFGPRIAMEPMIGSTELYSSDLKRISSYLSYELFDNGWYFYVAKDRGTIFS
jgi:hypothetical protein